MRSAILIPLFPGETLRDPLKVLANEARGERYKPFALAFQPVFGYQTKAVGMWPASIMGRGAYE